MKILISLIGRFHAFDLAEQIYKQGHTPKLVTTYPKFKVKEWNIPSKNIVSSPFLELSNRLKNKLPFIPNESASLFIKKLHSHKANKHLQGSDILVAWAGSSLQTIIKAKEKGIKVILERGSTHHSFQMNILHEESKRFITKFKPDYLIWERDLLEYELADYISIPSNFVKKSFIEYGVPEDKLIVNPYGVDLSSFKQVSKNDDTFRIIFCGQISFQKGAQYLLKAFYELNLQDAELWMIGAVSHDMKKYIKKFNSPRIIYKGTYPQSDLYKLYSQGNVFCMPSIQEGMAMVQLQAMACGLPLICTTNSGGEDLITNDGDEGFVIPIRDSNALKEKINYLYKNQSLCSEMGKRAMLKVSKGYTWDDYGKRTIENYEKILREKI